LAENVPVFSAGKDQTGGITSRGDPCRKILEMKIECARAHRAGQGRAKGGIKQRGIERQAGRAVHDRKDRLRRVQKQRRAAIVDHIDLELIDRPSRNIGGLQRIGHGRQAGGILHLERSRLRRYGAGGPAAVEVQGGHPCGDGEEAAGVDGDDAGEDQAVRGAGLEHTGAIARQARGQCKLMIQKADVGAVLIFQIDLEVAIGRAAGQGQDDAPRGELVLGEKARIETDVFNKAAGDVLQTDAAGDRGNQGTFGAIVEDIVIDGRTDGHSSGGISTPEDRKAQDIRLVAAQNGPVLNQLRGADQEARRGEIQPAVDGIDLDRAAPLIGQTDIDIPGPACIIDGDIGLGGGDPGDEKIGLRLHLDAAKGVAGPDAVGGLDPADDRIGARRGVYGVNGIDNSAAIARSAALGQDIRIVGKDGRRTQYGEIARIVGARPAELKIGFAGVEIDLERNRGAVSDTDGDRPGARLLAGDGGL